MHRAIEVVEHVALKAIHLRDDYTKRHSTRVFRLSRKVLSLYTDCHGVTLEFDKVLHHFDVGVKLHDIGKISWSDKVLKGTEKLTQEEVEQEQRKHPEIGAEAMHSAILGAFNKNLDLSDALWLFVILYHHWNYNNFDNSYPKSLEYQPFLKLREQFSECLIPSKLSSPDVEPVAPDLALLPNKFKVFAVDFTFSRWLSGADSVPLPFLLPNIVAA